jgi:hypothetical protein
MFPGKPAAMRKLLLALIIIPLISLGQKTSTPGNGESTINAGAEIYNGKMHMSYLPALSGTAYFLDGEWQLGDIMYHDIYYPSVWLKYDLVQKEVIMQHSNGVSSVILFTPRVQHFSILGKKFINVKETDSIRLPAGIYQQVEKGIMSFYINRSKYLVEDVTANGIERSFFEKDKYYMVKEGVVFKIENRRDLWTMVKDKKSSIRTYLIKKGLIFKKQPELTLTEVATYYNETSK